MFQALLSRDDTWEVFGSGPQQAQDARSGLETLSKALFFLFFFFLRKERFRNYYFLSFDLRQLKETYRQYWN